ncbi:restriction endonuclease subunit S [Chromobacterium violaceum]|uniref:restriction endonuclease subunit S n=1 Tax=Chromobacterium violaceum TaxID=536 RepID=UPI00143D64B0|nr:restriction endonuclease subunit S [Chromobacterium violaceum]QIY80962.1 restriction endonuclease subunit S [Chromobacterium violaceum]
MSFNLPELPESWTYASLGDCSQKNSITYGVVQPGKAVSDGTPIVRVNNFRNLGLDLSDVMRISPEVEAKYSRTRLKGGEVLLTIVGSVGQVAVVPDCLAGFNVARAVAVIHPLPHVTPKWIALCLRSPLSQYLLGSRANTTVQTTINLKDLRALPIPLPPENERQAISDFIGTLDDRITLLRETNATLEAIAQALFKSWFVDFDPVRAKMEGRAPEGMDEATAALFPDGFEESELGLTPRGWRTSTIGQSFILTMGQSPPGDTYNEMGDGLPFYQGRTDFGFRFPTQRVFCTSPTRLAEPGDTLVSVRAPVGDVNLALEKCCLGRGVASIRHPNGFQSFAFYSTQNLRTHFELYDGEGTVFGSINKKDFQALPVIAPDNNILQCFEEVVALLDARILKNEEQLRTLASLRDTLLPRLISGQLRLPEAEALIA